MPPRLSAACQCGKRVYTKGSARYATNVRNKRDGAGTWNAYRCPFTRHAWHIGHVLDNGVPNTREGRREIARKRAERLARPKTEKESDP